MEGSIGSIVDGGLLTLLSQIYQTNLYLSRLISFSFATLSTWALNRLLVFKHDIDPNIRKRVEYLRYLSVQICGGLTNLGVFTYVITIYPFMKTYLMIPFFLGSIFGLIINFTGSRYWVFKNSLHSCYGNNKKKLWKISK